jgi:hypothetical protein
MEPSIKEELTKEEISKIVKSNEITIPAGLLYGFLQFTEVFVDRGNIRANELTVLGNNYDFGSKIISELIKSKTQEIITSRPKSDVAPENVDKKKKNKLKL